MRVATLPLLALIGLSAAPARAADFFFKDGDTVVMIGDSITEQHLYSNYVEMWTVTRFPAWNLTFRNTGIGGDTSGGGNGRFARDVLRYKPTALTVDFGMNDGRYTAFSDATFNPYMKGLQGMAEQAKKANLRVAWITPQPLDTNAPGKTEPNTYNPTLEKFGAGVAEIAKKNDGVFVDQFHPYMEVLNKARAGSEKYAPITYRQGGGDAVHPGPAGQALMASAILKGLNFPTQVSAANIDGAKGQVKAQFRCQVTNLEVKDGGVSFQRLDKAFPFFPSEATDILKWAPLVEEMNDYRLTVTGLNEGKYAVRVGGTKIAEYTADELAKGVNLAAAALKAGPIAEQAKAVKAAVEAKNKYHHDQIFRGVVLAGVPDWLKLSGQEIADKKDAAFAERMTKMPALDEAVRKTLAMKPHAVEVLPAGQ